MLEHKFVFTCGCKYKFFVTAKNLKDDTSISCPNCKYTLSKEVTTIVIEAAQCISKIDELNEDAGSFFDLDNQKMSIEIKSMFEDYFPTTKG